MNIKQVISASLDNAEHKREVKRARMKMLVEQLAGELRVQIDMPNTPAVGDYLITYDSEPGGVYAFVPNDVLQCYEWCRVKGSEKLPMVLPVLSANNYVPSYMGTDNRVVWEVRR